MFRTINKRFSLYERTIVATMGGLVALALAAYVGLLVLTVVSAGERSAAERRIDTLRGEVAVAEKTYVDLSRSITTGLAAERGFAEIVDARYASDGRSSGALSVRDR